MRFLRWAFVFAAAAILSPGAIGAQARKGVARKAANAVAQDTSAAPKQPLSVRVVAYEITARLDPAKHTITASEVLTYHNLTGQPQQTFPFHMYLNAFQPQSTFFNEAARDFPDHAWEPENYGSIRVTRLEVVGAGDLTNQLQFIHPDDDNANDRTVAQVRLPKAIPPGADVQFKIEFEDQMPLVVARTGYIRDFFMVAQWFPKVGVWWKGAWNCHQFHFDTEFFADFGTYDVKLSVPQNEIVGAAGDLVASASNPDGTKTLEYHSEDVHDFSWAASPSFTAVEDSWTGSAGTVQIHMLMSPGNMRSAPRYLQALKGTMTVFDQWIGPYPYDRITVIDPPHGGWDAGGMEYPTLFTADNGWYFPKWILLAEDTVEHEYGHQYFQGMLATNEFEEPWLDEGLDTYLEAKVMNALYGKGTSFVYTIAATGGNDDSRRAFYLSRPDTDPIARLGWLFYDDQAYGAILYGKSTMVLLTLEKIIGEETVRRALHTFFLRYRFTHPTGDDFVKTVEEVSGRDLKWYFDQALYGTAILDYEILDADSEPLDSAKPEAGGAKSKKELYRTYVTVHRKGDFVLPEDIAIKFDDGQTVLEHWDGRDRWVRYQYDRPAALVSAEVDPGNEVWLDRNLFNNSYRVQADTSAQKKLGNFWLFLSEWFAQILAWIT